MIGLKSAKKIVIFTMDPVVDVITKEYSLLDSNNKNQISVIFEFTTKCFSFNLKIAHCKTTLE